MGRSRSRVLLGACLAALTAVNTVGFAAEEGDQYALLAPRRRVTEDSTPPPTSAASEMTLQTPATETAPPAPDASTMPAPELTPEMTEPAPEIPLASKGYTGRSSLPRYQQRESDFIPIPDRWRIGFPTGYRNEVGGFGHAWD